MLHWWRIFAAELVIIFTIIAILGYIKLPKMFRRKTIVRGFPWGYYPDSVQKTDPGFFDPNSDDFLHDVGTQFGGMEGFGDFGEFTGFGVMGEYGSGS